MNHSKILIDKIFRILRTNHTDSGFLFKGVDADLLEDTWKTQFAHLLNNGKVLDAQEAIKKAMSFRSKWNRNFPTYEEFYLYLSCENLPSMNWIICVVQQIKNNEHYNKYSAERGVVVSHRNKNAPDEWWEIAESIAKKVAPNFAQFTPEIAEKSIYNVLPYVCHDREIFKPNNNELNLSFKDVAKLSKMTVEKRIESLKHLKSSLNIKEKDDEEKKS
jgi:hypothetical protein